MKIQCCSDQSHGASGEKRHHTVYGRKVPALSQSSPEEAAVYGSLLRQPRAQELRDVRPLPSSPTQSLSQAIDLFS